MSESEVGRIYRSRATHSLPDFPKPWCFPHEHDYTIEVVARGGTPTDDIDRAMRTLIKTYFDRGDLNQSFGLFSTVENVAAAILDELAPLPILAVTVWEDQARWGRARSTTP